MQLFENTVQWLALFRGHSLPFLIGWPYADNEKGRDRRQCLDLTSPPHHYLNINLGCSNDVLCPLKIYLREHSAHRASKRLLDVRVTRRALEASGDSSANNDTQLMK